MTDHPVLGEQRGERLRGDHRGPHELHLGLHPRGEAPRHVEIDEEDQNDALGSEQALNHVIHDLWTDMLGFAGIEMHRRILGLAHNADFEDIADEKLRAACEAPALKFGRHIVVNRNHIQSLAELDRLAEALDQGKLS